MDRKDRMVSVPAQLLADAIAADASQGASAIQLANGWKAMAEIREIVDFDDVGPSIEESQEDLIKHLRGEIQRFESIFAPNDLMLLRGGEKMLELCAPEGKFVGVSWDDMREVLSAMIAVSPIGSGKLPE